MNRRRAAAPSRMSWRSSGEKKTVFNTPLSSEADLAGTLLTLIFFFRPAPASMRLINARSRVRTVPSSRNPPSPNRISSRSVRVRWDLPQERQTTASSRFVFPWAFSPQITLHTGWKSTFWDW